MAIENPDGIQAEPRDDREPMSDPLPEREGGGNQPDSADDAGTVDDVDDDEDFDDTDEEGTEDDVDES